MAAMKPGIGFATTTIKDLAADWKVSRRHIEKLLQRGDLDRVKVGRCTRIPEESIEAYLNGRNGNDRKHRPAMTPPARPTDVRSSSAQFGSSSEPTVKQVKELAERILALEEKKGGASGPELEEIKAKLGGVSAAIAARSRTELGKLEKVPAAPLADPDAEPDPDSDEEFWKGL